MTIMSTLGFAEMASLGANTAAFDQFPAALPAGGIAGAESAAALPAPAIEPVSAVAEQQRPQMRRWAMAGAAGVAAMALAGCGSVPFVSERNKHHGSFSADFAAGTTVYADHNVAKACGHLASGVKGILVWRNVGRQEGSQSGGFDEILGVSNVNQLKVDGDCGTLKSLDVWLDDSGASNRRPVGQPTATPTLR
jgi:hypothetical protein